MGAAPSEPVLSPASEHAYRVRITQRLRERGTAEEDIPARVEALFRRRLPIDFRAAGLFD